MVSGPPAALNCMQERQGQDLVELISEPEGKTLQCPVSGDHALTQDSDAVADQDLADGARSAALLEDADAEDADAGFWGTWEENEAWHRECSVGSWEEDIRLSQTFKLLSCHTALLSASWESTDFDGRRTHHLKNDVVVDERRASAVGTWAVEDGEVIIRCIATEEGAGIRAKVLAVAAERFSSELERTGSLSAGEEERLRGGVSAADLAEARELSSEDGFWSDERGDPDCDKPVLPPLLCSPRGINPCLMRPFQWGPERA